MYVPPVRIPLYGPDVGRRVDRPRVDDLETVTIALKPSRTKVPGLPAITHTWMPPEVVT